MKTANLPTRLKRGDTLARTLNTVPTVPNAINPFVVAALLRVRQDVQWPGKIDIGKENDLNDKAQE